MPASPIFVSYPDPLLSRAAAAAAVDAELRAVGERLRTAAIEARAYGLAAAHIGIVAPVIVVNTAPETAPRADLLLYNPRVVATATESAPGPEGSVSLPGVQVDILRPLWAEIAFEDGEGLTQSVRLEGFAARCALHEIEQMNGVFFLSHLSKLKRDRALKKSDKQRRAG